MADHSRGDGIIEKEAAYAEHIDTEKNGPIPQYDKFGAAAKVDPKEIALVRKIDCYMMV
jgi:hypothetical protein